MTTQVWAVDSLGGYMYSDNLSEYLRMHLQPLERFRSMCDADDASTMATKHGDTFVWNIYSDTADEAADLDETLEMPETNFTISQGTLTIKEQGIAVPYTGLLDNFSEHDVQVVIQKVLKNNAARRLDRLAHAQFDATPVTAAPVGGTSTTAVLIETTGCTVTNNVALGKDHVKAISDEMKERNIPSFDGSDYASLGRPTTFRTLKNDLEQIYQYVDPGFTRILKGEIGRYEGVRFGEQTNIASEGWTQNKSDAAYFFGEDTVMEGIVLPEEIRGKIPGDYGRGRGVAWYALLGHKIVHSEATQARIIKWDSAA